MSVNFSHAGLHFTLRVGFYEDGRMGEVFIIEHKTRLTNRCPRS